MPAYRFLVRGSVQGVGYRYFVLRQARVLGLAGSVRNLADGSVEVIAEGSAEGLSGLEHLLRAGPPSSEVTGVERQRIEPRGAAGFAIL